MGGRSAVHPLSPAVAAAAVCTVGCAASTLRRHTGPATAATAPSAGDLRFGAGFRPARHGIVCLTLSPLPSLSTLFSDPRSVGAICSPTCRLR